MHKSKRIAMLPVLIFSVLFISLASAQGVSPPQGQGVPIKGGLTQAGNTCQQASYAMAIVSLGLAGQLTPFEVFQRLVELYPGMDVRNCFNSMLVFLTNTQDQKVTIIITGAMGGPGKNITYLNNSLERSTKVRVEYLSTSISGPHPSGPVENGTIRIVAVTTKGNPLRHNIIITSVNRAACFTIPSIDTTTGLTLTNVEVCPITYWDPNLDMFIGSFMTSDGSYINLGGRWERATGTATISRGA